MRKLLASGIPVGAGTDATRVASYNPWIGLYWMVSGRTVAGTLLYDPDARLSRDEAPASLHEEQRWFSGEVGQKGEIAVGQHADLAVLSEDYFTVPEESIKRITSVLTMLGGKVVWASDDFAPLAPPAIPFSPSWSPPGDLWWLREHAAMMIANERKEHVTAIVLSSVAGYVDTAGFSRAVRSVHGARHGKLRDRWGGGGAACPGRRGGAPRHDSHLHAGGGRTTLGARRLKARGGARTLAPLLGVMTVALAAFAAAGVLLQPRVIAEGTWEVIAIGGLGGIAMGNPERADARGVSGPSPPTTVMTGNLTQLTMELVDFLVPAAEPDAAKACHPAHGRRFRRLYKFGIPLCGFVAGAAIGAPAHGNVRPVEHCPADGRGSSSRTAMQLVERRCYGHFRCSVEGGLFASERLEAFGRDHGAEALGSEPPLLAADVQRERGRDLLRQGHELAHLRVRRVGLGDEAVARSRGARDARGSRPSRNEMSVERMIPERRSAGNTIALSA